MCGYDMICSFDHGIAMRDGVMLRGNLFRPGDRAKHPVLLLRTVFRKDWMSRGYGQYDPAFWVRHGYAVYIQDVRGLGASQGEFDRFTSDGPDGYDTIEALAALSLIHISHLISDYTKEHGKCKCACFMAEVADF